MESKNRKQIALGLPLLLAAVAVVMNLPQIRRYLRARRM